MTKNAALEWLEHSAIKADSSESTWAGKAFSGHLTPSTQQALPHLWALVLWPPLTSHQPCLPGECHLRGVFSSCPGWQLSPVGSRVHCVRPMQWDSQNYACCCPPPHHHHHVQEAPWGVQELLNSGMNWFILQFVGLILILANPIFSAVTSNLWWKARGLPVRMGSKPGNTVLPVGAGARLGSLASPHTALFSQAPCRLS